MLEANSVGRLYEQIDTVVDPLSRIMPSARLDSIDKNRQSSDVDDNIPDKSGIILQLVSGPDPRIRELGWTKPVKFWGFYPVFHVGVFRLGC